MASHYLLANSGITPRRTFDQLKKIDNQTNAASAARSAEAFDLDNDQFIRSLQQKGREAMIAESLAKVHRDFDAYLEQHLSINFDEQRQRIMEHFGLIQPKESLADDQGDAPLPTRGSFGRSAKQGKSQFGATASGTRSILGRSGLEKSIIGSPGVRGSTTSRFTDSPEPNLKGSPRKENDRVLRDKESMLAEKVQQLNQARLKENVYPILEEFAMAEQNAPGDVSRPTIDHKRTLR